MDTYNIVDNGKLCKRWESDPRGDLRTHIILLIMINYVSGGNLILVATYGHI